MPECGIFFRFARNTSASFIAVSFALSLVLGTPQIMHGQSLGDVVITNRYANIRSGPGTKYRRIGRALRGERFTVTEIRPKWYRIIFQQKTGWVYAKLGRLERVSQQEVDRLVEDVQALDQRIDNVLEKLEDASSQLTEWVAKSSQQPESESTKPVRVLKPVAAPAWALIPGGPRLASGRKLTGAALLSATAGCLAMGLYYHDQYKEHLSAYRDLDRANRPEEFDRLHDKARTRLRLSDGLFYAAAGLYLFNIVDHFFILPRFGSKLSVEIDKNNRPPESGQRINLSLSRSF